MQPSKLLSRPAAILKDWDGTIVNTLPHVHEMHNLALGEMGLPPVDYATTIRMTGFGPMAASIVLGMSDADALEYQRRFARLFFIFDPQNLKLMPGVLEFMATITKNFSGLPLGVVSNKRGDILREEISHLGWDTYIKAVVAHGEAGENKPSPVPALAALQMLGVEPSKNVWFIGDTPSDIECALAAGLTAILVSDHPYAGPQPCHHFNDLHGLLDAYAEANAPAA